MPWQNTPEKRRRDAAVYQDPEYIKNRALARQRAAGRCECTGGCGRHQGTCGRRDRRLQCDHIIPVTQHGGHQLSNLRMLCSGPGSCHSAKSAREGGGPRKPATADPDPVIRTRW
jgi:HNH endonuclease